MVIIEYIASLVGFLLIIYFGWRKVAPPVGKLMKQRQDAIGQQVQDAKLAAERRTRSRRRTLTRSGSRSGESRGPLARRTLLRPSLRTASAGRVISMGPATRVCASRR